MQNYLLNKSENCKKTFFISNCKCEQLVFVTTMPIFLIPDVLPKILFVFSGTNNGHTEHDPRFKMILWSIVAGTCGGVNRAKILNLIKNTPMNANKIATVLNLDHKTVIHHVKILSKNDLIIKAEKDYAAEYQFTDLMKKNQNVLGEIMEKIGTK